MPTKLAIHEKQSFSNHGGSQFMIPTVSIHFYNFTIKEKFDNEKYTMVSGAHDQSDARYGSKARFMRRRNLRFGRARTDCHPQQKP